MRFLFFCMGLYLLSNMYGQRVWASEFFVSVVGPNPSGVGATWSFPFLVDEQWFLASGQGGDLTIAPMDESGWVDMEEVQTITDVGEIKDHAFRMCPDGQFLYAASTGIEDDVLVYTLASDFSIRSSEIIPQSNPLHAGNDMAAICSDSYRGVGVAELQGLRDYFYVVDEDGAISIPIELADAPRMTGAGFWEYDHQLYAVGRDGLPELSIAVYDESLSLQSQHLIPPISEEVVHYWSSSVVRVEDYFLLLSMGRDPQADWPMDTGDVYIAVLTKDMELVEWMQLTDFTPSEGGGMRPWMARSGDQLWVSYDRSNQVELFSISLQLEAFVVATQPSAEPTEEPSTEPTSEPDSSNSKEGGCGGLVLLPLLLFRRSRQ